MERSKDAAETPEEASREVLQERRTRVLEGVLEHVDAQAPLLVLKAPPGSGKTYVTLRAVVLARHRGQSVAVATQTNAQADDFCRRLAEDFPHTPAIRFASSGYREVELGASITWMRKASELPHEGGLVVATSAKWSVTESGPVADVLFIDEAWQMCWADFMLLSRVAPRFVMVGDPGQIAPVVPIDVSRWQTSRRPPHLPAPEVILRDGTLPVRALSLPVTTRLPHDTARLLRSFYDFDFSSWSRPGERQLLLADARPGSRHGVDGALDLLTEGSTALLTLPTPDSGPPLEEDVGVAEAAARVVQRLLERGGRIRMEHATVGERALVPEDIGVAATHRIMNTRILEALGPALHGRVRVDTPERWQGLERKVMVVVHPLSGVVAPSAFDLSTGRLCVMASRHEVGLVLVSRDHLGETLEDYLPVADQAVGWPDEAGRGHAQNLAVWQWLQKHGRISHQEGERASR